MVNSKEHSSEKSGRHLDLYSTVTSVLLHLAVFFGLIIIMRIAENGSGSSYGGYYVDMASPKGTSAGGVKTENLNPEKKAVEENKDDKKESLPDTKPLRQEEKETVKAGQDAGKKSEHSSAQSTGTAGKSGSGAGYYNMNSGGFDSTGLSQVYQESTLKVRLNYPSGWVYMDQQRKRKLDGITFWASAGSYNPPPYIHVEVVEKYIFNPEQYRYKYDFERFTGYYNDPVELENQVSQIIYIRTGDDEDYSIKLIMNGREAFKEFQPVFFAMVKSFRFGNSLF